jgi:hypothetical protein
MIIKPSPGRALLFQPARAEGQPELDQPLACTVAFVHNDRLVNIGGIQADGTPFSATSVPLIQPDDPVPRGGYYAQWMPYQVVQASRDGSRRDEGPEERVDAPVGDSGTAVTDSGPRPTDH